MSEKIQAKPYQKASVRDIEDFDGKALVAMDMGLGKTLVSLWTLLRDRIDSWPAVVVCPASVKYTWERTANSLGIMTMVAEGQTPPVTRRGGFKGDYKLLIINYEILKYWIDYIEKYGPNTIVIDECQYIASRYAKRTKAVWKVGKMAKNRIALSGTPLTNRPEELWPTLKFIRPDLFHSFFVFAQKYCGPKKTPWGWDYSGASNLQNLRALLLRTCMIRVLKKDVLSELPEKMRSVMPVEIVDRIEYHRAATDFINWMKMRNPSKVEGAKKSPGLTQIGYLLRLCARLKLRSVVDWCNNFLEQNPEEKLVIFAVHIKMIEALDRRILGGRHSIVNGSVVGRERDAAVAQFIHDKNTRVIIGNIQSMGTGVDGLQRAANTSVIVELPWTPGQLDQLESRTHRIGQKETSWYYYLVARDTIEEKMCKLLQQKLQIIRQTLDGEVLQEDLNIFDELMAAMRSESLSDKIGR